MKNASWLFRHHSAEKRCCAAELGIERSSRAELLAEGWRARPVKEAAGFWDRWRGLRPSSTEGGLILRTSSVHSFGMKADLWACGLAGMTVVDVRTLKPNRVVWMRGVDAILELPIHIEPPPLGSVLSWLDAGTVDPLRDADRQSW